MTISKQINEDPKQCAKADEERRRTCEEDRDLTKALENMFPASDPFSDGDTTGPEVARDETPDGEERNRVKRPREPVLVVSVTGDLAHESERRQRRT